MVKIIRVNNKYVSGDIIKMGRIAKNKQIKLKL